MGHDPPYSSLITHYSCLRPWSNQDVKVPVHLAGEIGQNHRSRVHFCHNRWARQTVAGPELGTVIDRSREELAVKVNTVLVAEGLGRGGSVQLRFGQG